MTTAKATEQELHTVIAEANQHYDLPDFTEWNVRMFDDAATRYLEVYAVPSKPLLVSNGYNLLYVGRKHPMSDKRGYCGEHRIVASFMLGRYLTEADEVYHMDSVKTNNHPVNLRVLPSRRVDPQLNILYRQYYGLTYKPFGNFARPKSARVAQLCKCGCGTTLYLPPTPISWADSLYIKSHEPNGLRQTVLQVLRQYYPYALTNSQVAEEAGFRYDATNRLLKRLRNEGIVEQQGGRRGPYCLTVEGVAPHIR